MAKELNIQVLGLKETEKFLKGKSKEAIELVKAGIKESTFHVQNKIKDSISQGTNAPVTVDTGRFLNSVEANPQAGVISTSVPYAKFLEYGTTKMKSRPHFRNTASVEKNKVKDIIQGELNKI